MNSWLRLANTQIPARYANILLDRFGDPDALFAAGYEDILNTPNVTNKVVERLLDTSFIPTSKQLSFMESASIRLIRRHDPDYPQPLKDISDPPVALFVRGVLDEKDKYGVALVGSRHATPYGIATTTRFSRELAAAGLTIVSGGAIGIDTAAHAAALEAAGRTLVILGAGLDIDYPKENRRMFDLLVERGNGALISEFPIGAQPEPWHFPLRNRIISGLSMAVVIIEAGEHSGSLLTAGLAGEQGRDVMAVPGNVDRPTSRGTNALIRDGAMLVESAQDILRSLGILVLESPGTQTSRKAASSPAAAPAPNLSDSQKRILTHLSLTPRHIDALATDVCMSPSDVSVQLTLMELSGVIRRLPGNCYIRVL